MVLTLLGEDRAEGRHISNCDVRVLATDIADDALQKAKGASYEAEALGQLPPQLHRTWIKEAGGISTIAEEARRIARFRVLNLQDEWPIKGRFEVIFCRNVMIYFDQAAKDRLIGQFAEHLVPGGHLYIGHSEQISSEAASLFAAVGATIYRREP
jgi:chemotaxis protein methyltransferase CheR